MWVKHNKTIYNSDYISKIEISKTYKTKIKATFNDGTSEVIGEFASMKECEDIFQSVSRALLFDDPDHPGIIIRDTKKGVKKNATTREL